MKKIIILMCLAFVAAPAFSLDATAENSVKDEVKRVKLEAKQRVEKIKADAKAAKIKAKADAKQAKIDAKNAEISAIAEAKRAKKEAEMNAKIADVKSVNDAKKAELNAAYQAKKDKIDAELNAKISKINKENDAKIAALHAKYEGKKAAPAVKTAEKTVEKRAEKAAKAKKTDTKEETENIKPAVNLKPAQNVQSETEADTKTIKAVDLKPRAVEKKPVVYSGINFETKKTEIMDELGLTEKQRASAEKLYAKNKEEIAFINIEIENTQKELKMLKKANTSADADLKANARHISNLQDKMNGLLQERDSVHNDAMKKFDAILDKDQKDAWLDIKNKGARLFPDIEAIR